MPRAEVMMNNANNCSAGKKSNNRRRGGAKRYKKHGLILFARNTTKHLLASIAAPVEPSTMDSGVCKSCKMMFCTLPEERCHMRLLAAKERIAEKDTNTDWKEVMVQRQSILTFEEYLENKSDWKKVIVQQQRKLAFEDYLRRLAKHNAWLMQQHTSSSK